MTLPSSPNQISFNDIRIELNVPTQSPFTLRSASLGSYGAIQQCQTPTPNTATPDAISDWYGYNHSATASLTINATTDYTSSNCTDACNGVEVGNTSLQAYTRDSSNYYGNTVCTTGLTAGYYAVLPRSTGCYTVAGSPASITLTACGSTTTTTTSTTTVVGTCYKITYTITPPGTSPTIQWQSVNGTVYTSTLTDNTPRYICSIILPTESPALGEVTIEVCSPADTCTNNCASLGCKSCGYTC